MPKPYARICLFGRFQARDPTGKEIRLPGRKAQLLLAALALQAPQPVPRDRLSGLLWADLPEERARHSLRQLLSSLRKALPVLRTQGDAVGLDEEACSIDVVEVRALGGHQDRQALRRVAELYRGPLLDGAPWEAEWLVAERQQLARVAARAMAQIARQCAASAEHGDALPLLQRWIELEPCAEEAHRLLMRCLDALGDRAAALQQYQRCVDALRREVGVGPSAETTALYRTLRDTAQPCEPSQAVADGFPIIAVFPVVNLTRDAQLGALCAALGEDLGGQLARLPGFEVLADRAVAAAAQEAGLDIRRVARALRARFVVTGSLRRLDGGSLRVAVQLLEGESAQYLWTQLTDLPASPRQAELDGLLAGIAGALEQQLTVAASRRAEKPRDAWGILRRASSLLFSRGWSRDAVVEAIALYREAVNTEPAFALARAHKALIIALSKRWGLIEGNAWHEEARADAEQALAMAPHNSEVLGYAGCAIADLGDPLRALPIIERAVQENPGNAQAWAALGATQLLLRRVEAGVESLRHGLHISPTDYRRSVWQTALAGGLARLKQYAEAVEVAQAACRSDVNFAPARIVLAGALMKQGREAEAARALGEAHRLRPELTPAEVRLWVGNRSLDKFDAGLTPFRTTG